LAGVSLVGLFGGDPRGARDLDAATLVTVAGALVAASAGWVAWRAGRRRTRWLLGPAVLLALVGGLSGWIAGVEILGDVNRAAHLAAAPRRVAFLVGLTSVGMTVPAVLLLALADAVSRLRPRGAP
jgi:hypothetical protein